jgi:hypothetical protein
MDHDGKGNGEEVKVVKVLVIERSQEKWEKKEMWGFRDENK